MENTLHIQNYFQHLIKKGVCSSIEEAKSLTKEELEVLRIEDLAKNGLEDLKAGRSFTLTSQTAEDLKNRIEANTRLNFNS